MQAQEGVARRVPSCLLRHIHQQWPPGTWVEQFGGTMGMGAAEPDCVLGVHSAGSVSREDSTLRHRERAAGRVRDCQGLTDLGETLCFHVITPTHPQSTASDVMSPDPLHNPAR